MRLSKVVVAALALAWPAHAALAASGAEVLKALNHDGDKTLEIPEVIAASAKLFHEINPDGDTTLESDEVKGRISASDWKRVNKDGDKTLEMDEWLQITRQRFKAADKNRDGKLTETELDSKAGQQLILLILK
jgi:hypothetical protein